MGLIWCRIFPPDPQPSSPFRISDLAEEELILHKLQYLKNVLVEQKSKYLESENKEISLAKNLRKSNVSEAKFHIQKAKLCRTMKNRISDRIFLVTKQIHNLQSTREDISFANTIKSSNQLLAKLTNEVNSKSLLEAIEVIETTENRSQELQDLLVKYNALPGQDVNKDFDELSETPSQTNINVPLVNPNTLEDLERKERTLADLS